MNPLVELQIAVSPYLGKLEAFETAEEIRQFLAAEGIKAVPSSASTCAIAEYVRQGSGVRVCVSRYNTYIRSTSPVGKHTKAMSEFTQRFDRGEYRELLDWERSPQAIRVALCPS